MKRFTKGRFTVSINAMNIYRASLIALFIFWLGHGVKAIEGQPSFHETQAGMLALSLDQMAEPVVKLRNKTQPLIGQKHGGISIVDGKSGQELDFVNARSPTKKDGAAYYRWRTRDGNVAVEHEIRPFREHISWKVKITNRGASQQWLTIRLGLDFSFPDNFSFFDGHSVHSNVTENQVRNKIRATFPMSCVYSADTGLALGIEPHQYLSYIESGVEAGSNKGGRCYYGTKIVIDPGDQETLEFIIYGFQPDYGHLDALQVYYDLYPDVFGAHAGIDRRIKKPSAILFSWYPPQKAELIRRGFHGYEWCYSPFKRSGDWYGKKEHWKDYQPPESYRKKNDTKADAYDEYGFPTKVDFVPGIECDIFHDLSAFHRSRQERFDLLGRLGNIAMIFYTINWCEKSLAQKAYPEAMIKDRNTVNELGPWVKPYGTDVRMFFWGNKFAEDSKRDFRKIADDLNVSGFGFDVAGGGVRHHVGGKVADLGGRAFDAEGAYYDEGIGIAKMAEYIHTLKKDNRTMAALGNSTCPTYPIAFNLDTSFVEAAGYAPLYILANMEEMKADRYLWGRKTKSFWWRDYFDETGSKIQWGNMSSEEIINVYRRVWDATLLTCLYLGIQPGGDFVWGVPEFREWLPAVMEATRAGWEPAPAAKSSAELWVSRYGKGIGAFINFGNPTPKTVKTKISVDNKRLGAYTYIFSLYNGEAVDCHLTADKTDMELIVPAKSPVMLRSVLGVKNHNLTKAVAFTKNNYGYPESLEVVLESEQPGAAQFVLWLPDGQDLVSVEVDGRAAPVSFTAEGIEFQARLEQKSCIRVRYRSQTFTTPLRDIIDFPFVDQDRANCKIVINAKADEGEKLLAWRIQEYFRFFYKAVEQKDVVIPIVGADKVQPGDNLVVIATSGGGRLAKTLQLEIPSLPGDKAAVVARTNNILYLAGRDASSTEKALFKMLELLDKKYVYTGMFRKYVRGETKLLRDKIGILGKPLEGPIGKIVGANVTTSDTEPAKESGKEQASSIGARHIEKTAVPPQVQSATNAPEEEFRLDTNTTFLAHFNHSLNADFSRGDPFAKGSASLTINGGGRFGEGLAAKKGVLPEESLWPYFSFVNYDIERNINPECGTLEMWIKPDFPPLSGKSSHTYILFHIPVVGGICQAVLSIREVADARQLAFSEQTAKDKIEGINAPVNWRAGDWHHVAVTWSVTERALYVDGIKLASRTAKSGLEIKEMMCAGSFAHGSAPAESTIDELRISDVVRYTENFRPSAISAR